MLVDERGAEEIVVNVESDIKGKEKKFIRLDAESYSSRNDSLKIIHPRSTPLSRQGTHYTI